MVNYRLNCQPECSSASRESMKIHNDSHSSATVCSSIQKDDHVLQYCGRHCKYYYLPLFSDSLMDSRVASILGSENSSDRNHQQILSSLIRADRGHYSHIKIPMDRIHPLLKWTTEQASDYGLGVVLQVCTRFLQNDDFFSNLVRQNRNFEIEWVFNFSNDKVKKRFSRLSEHFLSSHLSIPVHKHLDWNLLTNTSFFKTFPDIHLYFRFQKDIYGSSNSCRQIHRLMRLLHRKFPEKNFFPPKGTDLHDYRVHQDFNMEPCLLPCLEMKAKEPKIRYSVVIPTFNNQNHLLVVIKHLLQQNIGVSTFEIIVVDDGSTDQTQVLLMEFLKSLKETVNFKYIFFPRSRKRVMGDSRYRAGISRNLGAKSAVGEILCFLDSDIVVPKNYLQKVGEALKTWDGVQAKRKNLCEKASHLDIQYNFVNQKKDVIPNTTYWEKFNRTKNWHSLPYNWKYVYTNSFSIKRELFWKLGGLKKNFIFYGFEDTELGYRLVKQGCKLHLLDMDIFHLFHKNTRSEFFNHQGFRDVLLNRTARILYLSHLDQDIYESLLKFMGPEPTIKYLIKKLLEILSFQFFWMPEWKVYSSLKKAP